MPERFEGGERSKGFSEEEVTRIQNSIRKIREVVGWDLGALCSTSEEAEMVHQAKKAMKDIAVLFHVPEVKFWTAFPSKDMSERIRQAAEYNERTLPTEAIIINPADLERLLANLAAIDEVIKWDIGAGDETEANLLREARESLGELKRIF